MRRRRSGYSRSTCRGASPGSELPFGLRPLPLPLVCDRTTDGGTSDAADDDDADDRRQERYPPLRHEFRRDSVPRRFPSRTTTFRPYAPARAVTTGQRPAAADASHGTPVGRSEPRGRARTAVGSSWPAEPPPAQTRSARWHATGRATSLAPGVVRGAHDPASSRHSASSESSEVQRWAMPRPDGVTIRSHAGIGRSGSAAHRRPCRSRRSLRHAPAWLAQGRPGEKDDREDEQGRRLARHDGDVQESIA